MKNMIEIQQLNKSFGEIKAVQNLSFTVREGELYAFLGINGAGKSTTISIICGQLEKDSGKVFVDGTDIDKDIQSIKSELGVVFQSSVLDKELTVNENLESRAAMYGIFGKAYKERIKELSEVLNLNELFKRTVKKLSGGQKRRVDIARALLHNPKLLILDEPTTGLDPQTRKNIWEVVAKLRKEKNMTVLLTTHYMEEAGDADYVLIIDSGKIAAEGTPLELKNKYTDDYITVYNADEEQVKAFGLPYTTIRDAIRISVPDIKKATELIIKNQNIFTDFELTKGKMDDVFLNVTGKTLGGGAGI